MEKKYSMEIADQIREYLDQHEWHYYFDDEHGLFRFGLTIKSTLKNVQFTILVLEKEYNVYASSPIGVDANDPAQLNTMAEFVCRVNYGLRAGNFEMDFNDGEIRYKTYTNCDGVLPTPAVLAHSIGMVEAMFTKYGDGIVQILFNGKSAKEAVDYCEKDMLMRLLSMMHKKEGSDEDGSKELN